MNRKEKIISSDMWQESDGRWVVAGRDRDGEVVAERFFSTKDAAEKFKCDIPDSHKNW